LPQQLHTNMICAGTCRLKFLCCCVAALVMAEVFYPAEYISAGLHALGSCSTGAMDLGAVFEYVNVYGLVCVSILPANVSF